MASQGEGPPRRPAHDRRAGGAGRRRGHRGSRRGHRRSRHVRRGQRPAQARCRRPPADHPQHLHLRRLAEAAHPGGAARRPEPGDRLLTRDRTGAQAGRGGHRGPALLPARGPRLPLHRAGAAHRPARRPHRAGRLDHHPAVHQERLPASGPAHRRHPVAQDPRSGARRSAREALVQRRDPHRLPEHHLLRRERLRHRDGGAHVLRHERPPPDAAAGGAAGRHRPGPERRRPVRRAGRRPSPPPRGARRHGTQGHGLGGGCRGSGARAAAAAAHGLPTSHLAPYFVEYVIQQLVDQFGAATAFGGGLRVYTTLDPRVQRDADRAATASSDEPGDPSVSIVAIDPHTDEVKALVGGRDFAAQQFDVAVDGRRQPGSAFKPFALATAIRQGLSPPSIFISEPKAIDLGGGSRLAREHLLGHLRRQDLADRRHGRVRQHRLRRPVDDGRPRQHRRHGRRHGDHQHRSATTRRSRSAA